MNLCDLVDDAMLTVSSVVSQKWNEYTGSTKYALANVLNVIAPAPVIGANIFQVLYGGENDIANNTLASIAFLAGSGINYFTIRDIEKTDREQSISESMMAKELYD